jgi:hypothetical protein
MPWFSVAEAPSGQRSPESSPPKVREVFLAGRTPTSVEAAAKQIEAAGGRAHADVVDALDAAAVEEYFESVVQQAKPPRSTTSPMWSNSRA